jgi:hypothetical protein
MLQLSLEIIYHDEHLLEIRVSATNGRYSGVTSVYLNEDGQQLIDFGNQLKGFPERIGQVEEIEFGFTQKYREEFQKLKELTPPIEPAIAYVGFRFYCIDSLGHTAVFVNLQEEVWSKRAEAIGKVTFEMRFEPAQLDKFAEELVELGKKKEGMATLLGIPDDKDS